MCIYVHTDKLISQTIECHSTLGSVPEASLDPVNVVAIMDNACHPLHDTLARAEEHVQQTHPSLVYHGAAQAVLLAHRHQTL